MYKKIITMVSVAGLALAFSGCSTDNPFGVGYESSACEQSKDGGLCGSPSAIYKYKNKVKEVQKNYLNSGYPDKLYFAISRDGRVMVKKERDAKWRPYIGSSYESKINAGLKTKYKTNLGSGYKSTSSDIPVGENNDLSVSYNRSAKYIQTRTNVGRMIRDNGEYSRVWIAPYVDNKGDLVSAHEVYAVIRDPKWVIGEKTPKKVLNAATPIPSPISVNMLEKTRKPGTVTIKTYRKVKRSKSPSDAEINNFIGK